MLLENLNIAISSLKHVKGDSSLGELRIMSFDSRAVKLKKSIAHEFVRFTSNLLYYHFMVKANVF